MALAVVDIVLIVVIIVIEAERVECLREGFLRRNNRLDAICFLLQQRFQVFSRFHTEERIQESRISHGNLMLPHLVDDILRAFKRDDITNLIILDDLTGEMLDIFCQIILTIGYSIRFFRLLRGIVPLLLLGFYVSRPLALRKDFFRLRHAVGRIGIGHAADCGVLLFERLPSCFVLVVQIDAGVDQTLDALFGLAPGVSDFKTRPEGMDEDTLAAVIHKSAFAAHQLLAVSAETIFLLEELRALRSVRLMLIERVDAHLAALKLASAQQIIVEIIFGQRKSGR